MLSENLTLTLRKAFQKATDHKHEFATLEHLLLALAEDPDASTALIECSIDVGLLCNKLNHFLNNELHDIILPAIQESKPTAAFQRVTHKAAIHTQTLNKKEITGVDILAELFTEKESYAALFLTDAKLTRKKILQYLSKSTTPVETTIMNPGALSVNKDPSKAKEEASDPLEKFCVNLNKLALDNKIDALIGRDDELERLTEVLSRRSKNNPLLIGEPGVGKTAIVEGLALCIATDKVPEILKKAVIYSLDLGALVAGTKFRGDFEERLKQIIKNIQETESAILFIDEIHSIIGAGSTQGGGLDVGNLLKPMLARGNLRCIGSTTFKEYQNYFEKDAALARRFQKITIDEPSVENAITMLKGLKSFYEKYHNIEYSDEAITEAVILSDRYISDRHLPDKAIDVIDEAGAHCRLSNQNLVTEDDIESIIAKMVHIPVKTIAQDESEQMSDITKRLKTHIFGQDHAIDELVSVLKLSKAGLRSHAKPMGCYLFSGPTGVGKTELAKQVATALSMELHRYDMSEYMEKHSVSRLIGTPPGYVGFEQGGMLTDKVRKAPYSVVLMDEVEKAHPDIHNILLQVMDYGKATDTNGVSIDFSHTIVIMTTNAGVAINKHNIGFNELEQIVTNSKEANEHISRSFSPEFRNRLDAIIEFAPLSESIISQIVDKYLMTLKAQLDEQHITTEIDAEAKEYICNIGFDTYNGARELERIIDKKLKQPLAEEILFGELKDGGNVHVKLENKELKFYCTEKETACA
jgi:ATP-dependent Clp protease ATP-binding subunit ClpA